MFSSSSIVNISEAFISVLLRESWTNIACCGYTASLILLSLRVRRVVAPLSGLVVRCRTREGCGTDKFELGVDCSDLLILDMKYVRGFDENGKGNGKNSPDVEEPSLGIGAGTVVLLPKEVARARTDPVLTCVDDSAGMTCKFEASSDVDTTC
jgi:hypothetical protein